LAAASLTYGYLPADKRSAEPVKVCASDPELFSEALTIATLQAGAALVIVFQALYLLVDLHNPPHPLFRTVPYHLFNIAAAVVGFLMTLTATGRTHWRALATWVVAAVTVGTIAIAVASGNSEPFCVSIILLVTGTAALLPWEPKWQVAIDLIVLGALMLETALVADHFAQIHWLGTLIAIGLAQSSTVFSEHYRREIERARTAALEASEAKSGFLSSMSHEIRTPMNAIIGLAEVLKDTQLNGEQRRYLDTMLASGKGLLDLINNILDLAKIESGRLSTMAAEFDLVELSEQVADSLSLRAHEKRLELTLWIAPEVPARVIGDPLRLRQILINLLGNAVKFTEYGEVSMAVELAEIGSDSAQVAFTFTDTGIGIPQEKVSSIFEKFTQVDSSASRRHEGSGLGLTIVKRLLELLGGTLSVESEMLRGSRFRAVVPFKLGAAAARRTMGPDLSGSRVLIADDNATSREVLRKLISSAGGAVEERSSGEEALAALRAAARDAKPYSAVLIDCRMSATGGFELAEKAAAASNRTAVVLMLTTDELNMRLARMRELDLKFYVVKPVKRVELLKMLHDAMAGRLRDIEDEHKAEAPSALPNRARILLAEDNPTNSMLIKAFLKDAPIEIDVAENGAVALSKFVSQSYDLVLMDMFMPVVDGYDAVRAIRKWEAEQQAIRTPIVALTAAALLDDRNRSLDAGCDFHVTKPVSKAVLLDLIRGILEQRAQQAPEPETFDTISDLKDPAVFAEISELFVSEMNRLLTTIDHAFANSEFEKMREAAHSLKGSAGAVGARRIVNMCRELELAISLASVERIERAVRELQAEAPQARARLERRVEELAQA
jgi:two-component system sensor histidine kinase/response regulator